MTEKACIIGAGSSGIVAAIMPLAQAQSEWVAKLLTGQCGLPPAEVMEREIDRDLAAMAKRYVTSTRHTIQVDFYPYLRALRREMKRRAAARPS